MSAQTFKQIDSALLTKQHFATSSIAISSIPEQCISKQSILFLTLLYMKALFCVCIVEMNKPVLPAVLFVFQFTGQIKRLEEQKTEQDKQLKSMSKQMKVDFLRFSPASYIGFIPIMFRN